MLNIVIPMAGRGSRFQKKGYKLPKPLIDVNGQTMVECVTENLRPSSCEYKFIYLCLQEHIEKYDLVGVLNNIAPTCQIIAVDQVTQGAACTVLLAEELINNDYPLMIANCDQYIETSIDSYLNELKDNDGLIMIMKANDPKWSFISINENGYVKEVREKEVISDEATVGIYNFKKGRDFVRFAYEMIDKELRVNGEFYVAPVYNLMIKEGKRIGYYNIGKVEGGMYGLGTPEDLSKFLNRNK